MGVPLPRPKSCRWNLKTSNANLKIIFIGKKPFVSTNDSQLHPNRTDRHMTAAHVHVGTVRVSSARVSKSFARFVLAWLAAWFGPHKRSRFKVTVLRDLREQSFMPNHTAGVVVIFICTLEGHDFLYTFKIAQHHNI